MIWKFGADSRTPPVAQTRKCPTFSQLRKQSTPVFGGIMGACIVIVQCACSSVYLRYRMRFSPRSSSENVGTVWKRRQPTETSMASPVFRSLGCQRWRFTRACTMPMRLSPGSRPPSTIGRSRLNSATQAAGTSSRRMRTKWAMATPSVKPSRSAAALAAAAASAPLPAASCPSTFFGASPSAASSPPPSSFSFFSSSSLLQPPVMNFRSLRASFASSSKASASPGRASIRAVSMPSRSPRFPRSPERSGRGSSSSSLSSAPPSSSSSSNKGTVAWSVAFAGC
mmetsp:Transcript_86927/g.281532  ORF Transcript_86927/g.281532 Transcript_86927/m.281532 type:complete len:283 (+) Transcript_86927:788-1636(+)